MFSDFFSIFGISKKRNSTKFFLNRERRKKLKKILGFKVIDETYYIKALTHRSYLDISPEQIKSNERLEFLGDSVLGLITAEFLFKQFPNEKEGFLTKTRSHLVDTTSLIKTANLMSLADIMYYDKRFLDLNSIGIKKITADALEALIGAVYLDVGLAKTRKLVKKWILKPNFKSGAYKIDKNYKGQLLELAHVLQFGTPSYFVLNEEGPEHNKTFNVSVKINDVIYGNGKGRNKKTAEQKAAKKAIQKLKSKSI